MTFGEALTIAMEHKGIKANELAEKSGLSAPYISKLRRGKTGDPSWTKACMLIAALGMTPTEFDALQRGE